MTFMSSCLSERKSNNNRLLGNTEKQRLPRASIIPTYSYTCIGTHPINATLCTRDQSRLLANTQSSSVISCTKKKCEYKCNIGNILKDGVCITDTLLSSRIAAPLNLSDMANTNIVLIYADDLGYGHLGSYGQKKIKTPRLDKMAKEGLKFDNFYAGGAYCFASRIAMLTGRHLGQNIKMRNGFVSDSPTSPEYLPRFLQNAGYRTGIFGKWGFGTCDKTSKVIEKDPYLVGFDEFLGYLNHRGAHTYTLPPYPLIDKSWPIDKRLFRIVSKKTIEDPNGFVPYTHEVFIQKALDFVTQNRNRKFFLYLPITIPHAELFVPQDRPGENLLGQYLINNKTSIFPEVPWSGDRIFSRPVAKPRATFAAMISRMDRDVGRLLDRLKALNIHKKTLVIFTSDNGPHDAGGILGAQFFNGSGNLNGMKWKLQEGGIRVPMIAYWPGTIAASRTEKKVFSQTDFLSTFVELSGKNVQLNTTGVSLLPTILDKGIQKNHDFLYWQARARYSGEAIRIGKWKAIRKGISHENDLVQLFNLNVDPYEKMNLAEASLSHRGIVKELKKKMNEMRSNEYQQSSGLYKMTNLKININRSLIQGTEGNDNISGSYRHDEINGNGGDDQIQGQEGDDLINGNKGKDNINGNIGNDVLRGGKDDDFVRGGQGSDQIFGNLGNDILYGDLGEDELRGGPGNDTLYGGNQNIADVGDLDDLLYGEEGDDKLYGHMGDDKLYGGPGSDFIQGNQGKDYLSGNTGNDVLRGGQGDDILFGDEGNDTLYGDKGNDLIYGGIGNDTYYYKLGDGHDSIEDSSGEDTLYLTNVTIISEVRVKNNLIISFQDGGELVLVNHYSNGKIEHILN